MEELPTFPNFRRIRLEDRVWYDPLYAQFDPYADFSFGNLLIWLDQHNDLALAQLNDNVILRCTNLYMSDRTMFNILGDNKIDDTIATIFEYQKTNGLKIELLGVPEFVIERVAQPHLLTISEDRDNFEYIIDTKLLGYLDGPSMKKIRQDINGYERRAEKPVTVFELDLNDQANVDYLRSNVEQWEKAFATNDTASQEYEVILRTFSIASTFGYKNMSVKVGDELAGFALYQPISYPNVAIANHLKTSYHYRHTSFFLTHHLARLLADNGIDYINYEQDLGLAGLRDFKTKLRPAFMLPKYNLTPRD